MLDSALFILSDCLAFVFMQFALPHIMGWDQALTNHHPSPPAISKPRVERPHPDSEWER
jgi:hypothetical protein